MKKVILAVVYCLLSLNVVHATTIQEEILARKISASESQNGLSQSLVDFSINDLHRNLNNVAARKINIGNQFIVSLEDGTNFILKVKDTGKPKFKLAKQTILMDIADPATGIVFVNDIVGFLIGKNLYFSFPILGTALFYTVRFKDKNLSRGTVGELVYFGMDCVDTGVRDFSSGFTFQNCLPLFGVTPLDTLGVINKR